MSFFFLCLMVMLSVAYFTLLERVVLGSVQERFGPNKVGPFGVVQPVSDGFKLFLSGWPNLSYSIDHMFYLSPVVGFFLSLSMLMVYPMVYGLYEFSMGVLIYLCLVSLTVYPVMFMGWFSWSQYGALGAQRSVAQSLSYEVSMSFMVLAFLMPLGGYSFSCFYNGLWGVGGVLSWGLFITWWFILLSESHRTPFDLAEGESELVSGFNIEYGSSGFALVSLTEYGNMITLGMVSSYLFFPFGGLVFVLFIIYFFLLCRVCYPRMRYDHVTGLMWSGVLPVSMFFMFFMIVLL